MKFRIFLLLSLLLFVSPIQIFATYDPASVPNNKFGIHIVDTNDIPDLPALVNSSGGDWGYVTIVLSDGERNRDRWQAIFNQMRRAHLIPIVRLATHIESGSWAKPNKDRFYEIVNLLDSLNWPTQNRYVILYNEPNHANEWGGTLNPEEYAEDLVTFATALKKTNEDFFILPAGLDASSADDGVAMDEAEYLRRMIAAKPDVLTLIDGWTSHSYPNPAFSGSPYAVGRGTLRTYDWELSYLKSLGLTKNLPIFITETGWQHAEGKSYIAGSLTAEQVAANIGVAARGAWTDPRIVAITPFLFNYQDVPFDHFSWKKLGSLEFYPSFDAYKNIPKIPGEPKQRDIYALLSPLIPGKLITGSSYTLNAIIKNDGQGILSDQKYQLKLTDGGRTIDFFSEPLPTLEPGDTGTISIHLKTPENAGPYPLTLTLIHGAQTVILEHRDMTLVPPPSVEIHAQLGWRKTSEAQNARILVYDDLTLLQKFTGLAMKDGVVSASGLVNVVPGRPYRVVLLVDGYLPRQVIGALSDAKTVLYPSRMLPLDSNNDGKFSFTDLQVLLKTSPFVAFSRFFGP